MKKNITFLVMAVLAPLFFLGCAGGGKEPSSISSDEKIVNDDDRLRAISDPFIIGLLKDLGVDADITESNIEAYTYKQNIHWIVMRYGIQSQKEGDMVCALIIIPIKEGTVFKLDSHNSDQYGLECYHVGDEEGRKKYEAELRDYRNIANNYGAGGKIMAM